METATTPSVRNVALVGHGGSGKTTLAEALLLRAGAVPRAGRVEDGSTVCDHEPEEVARGSSVSLGVADLDWTCSQGCPHRITLLDTPGSPDFAGAVDAALAVADLAVVVVSAVDGVQSGTEAVWRRCDEAGIPRLVVVSQEDRARADFHRVLDHVRDLAVRTGRDPSGVVPLELPLGEEQALHGVADVLSDRGLDYGSDGRHHDCDLPADVADEEHRLHGEVTEEIVAHDDDQLERYLSGEEPGAADLERTLAREVVAGEAVPVLVASAATGVGVDRLADLVCEIGPSPADRPAQLIVGGGPGDGRGAATGPGHGAVSELPADPDGETVLHVFRTVADPFVGQVSVFKVLSGTVRSGDRLVSPTTGAEERLHGLFRLRGREHLPVDVLPAGAIGAVAKLAGAPSGTLLASRAQPVRPAALPAREPVLATALVPVSQADDDKLSAALTRLAAEDPTLRVDRTPHQTVLRGLGDAHLAVAVDRLARVFGVHVTTEPVRIAYRETLAGPAEAEGRLKKQSGGHGQFAVVQLRLTPRPPGSGFAFVDSVVGGAVPRSYLPAVERGAAEALAAGGPLGHPVVDVQVEVHDGKAHAVDSSDMAFRTAAAAGVRAALASAGTVLLEPTLRVSVVVPPAAQGDVLGDLSGRRGRITATGTTDDGRVRVEAVVPEAELVRYALDLRSLTGGHGELTLAPGEYEVRPGHLTPA
ncbi:translation factor GTPase family protein [Cellulomonas sp. C5510]|uniref:elongation factor G n=1 Tax=Cellulomonas sp. C5510 TaxID=2871170 RepID=UPI001C93E1A1|nr:elongation factor G [Cellulomonas sp. C5510]QZN85779.1 elongation factor G [Cellulomonas sp. C5510]